MTRVRATIKRYYHREKSRLREKRIVVRPRFIRRCKENFSTREKLARAFAKTEKARTVATRETEDRFLGVPRDSIAKIVAYRER